MRKLLLVAVPLAAVLLAAPAVVSAEETTETEASEHHVDTNPIKNVYRPHWGKDVHGDSLEPGEEPMPAPFLAAWLNFALFAWVVGRFGGPAIRDYVKNRHETIVTALEESARLRQDAQAKLDEYTRRLSALDADIDRMVGDIRREAESDKARIIAEAQARAERMRRDADQQIQAEIRATRLELERKAVDAAVVMAERILADRMSEQDQVQLANRFVDQVTRTASTGGRS